MILPNEKAKGRRHVIISGTGRAGTTFLVQVLTELGLDTGFSNAYEKIHADRNAGMEWDLRKPGPAPYIVKSPALCEHLEGLLEERDIIIDHAIVPVRDLYCAAESRRDVARKGNTKILTARAFLGIKKWRVRKPEEQENVLAHNFYNLLHTIAKHDIPLTVLYFPRLATDPEYLFSRLQFLLRNIPYGKFLTVFQKISQPKCIHNFESKKPTSST